MIDIFTNFVEHVKNLLDSFPYMAPILASLLIILESIIPIIPLFVFITINFVYFGVIAGFLISWIFTIVGCYISYTISRKLFAKKFEQYKDKYFKLYNFLQNVDVNKMTLFVAIPFSPAFLINILAGISNVPKKKFLTAIIIGKISIVYFWGMIGTSLIESLNDPVILIKISGLLITTYIISKVVNDKLTKS